MADFQPIIITTLPGLPNKKEGLKGMNGEAVPAYT
jgi:hypothetical protein